MASSSWVAAGMSQVIMEFLKNADNIRYRRCRIGKVKRKDAPSPA